MSRNIRRRTAVLLVAASVGLLGAVEAQAGGARRADRVATPKASVANQIQGFVRILWQQAGDLLDDLMRAPAGHHREGHNPPGHQRCGTANGPGIDPDGRFNGNDRNGNNGYGNDC